MSKVRPANWQVRTLLKWVYKEKNLSNSGDTLEFQVPNHKGNLVGGWSNDSCTVTSLETSEERKGGNRGTKSDLRASPDGVSLISVKAQRVDGSRTNLKSNGLVLRYTLKSFERNLVIKVLPHLKINPLRYAVTRGSPREAINYTTSVTHPDPWFVTGFTDAEGCFTVVLQKNSKAKNGYSISARFKAT